MAAGCVIGIGMVVAKAFLPAASLQAARLALYQDFLAEKLLDDGDADTKAVLSALSPFEWRIRLLAPTHVYEQFLLLYRSDDSAEALLENPLFDDLIDRMGAEF